MESMEDRYPASRCGTGRSMDNAMAGRATFNRAHNDLANCSPLERSFPFALEAQSLQVSSMIVESVHRALDTLATALCGIGYTTMLVSSIRSKFNLRRTTSASQVSRSVLVGLRWDRLRFRERRYAKLPCCRLGSWRSRTVSPQCPNYRRRKIPGRKGRMSRGFSSE